MVSAFIDDGYTEAGFVAAQEGLHPECEFEYRPMTPIEIGRYLDRVNGKSSEQTKQIAAETVVSKLISWSLTKEAPTSERYCALRTRLYERIYEVVFGWGASDSRPGKTTETVSLQEEAKNS